VVRSYPLPLVLLLSGLCYAVLQNFIISKFSKSPRNLSSCVRSYPLPLVLLLSGLCYAVISPLILPFTAAFFGLACLTWTHQLLYEYTTAEASAFDTGASQV
jgi:hypothetical protein